MDGRCHISRLAPPTLCSFFFLIFFLSFFLFFYSFVVFFYPIKFIIIITSLSLSLFLFLSRSFSFSFSLVHYLSLIIRSFRLPECKLGQLYQLIRLIDCIYESIIIVFFFFFCRCHELGPDLSEFHSDNFSRFDCLFK